MNSDARQEQEPEIASTLRRYAKDMADDPRVFGPCQASTLDDLADALTALSAAVNGCGKKWYDGPCGAFRNCMDIHLCFTCYQDRDAAIRTLLGKTEAQSPTSLRESP